MGDEVYSLVVSKGYLPPNRTGTWEKTDKEIEEIGGTRRSQGLE